MAAADRDYIRDKTLEGHETARGKGKSIGGVKVADVGVLAMALQLREQNLSLRDMASRPVITKGKKKGQHPSSATVMRMLRERGEQAAVISAP